MLWYGPDHSSVAAEEITLAHIGPTSVLNAPRLFTSTFIRPVATVSNDGWDTAPTPGQPIHEYLDTEDSNYITVTV